MKRASKPEKPYWEMNLEELREATREFDQETLHVPGKPLSAADRKLFAAARRRAQIAQRERETGTEEVCVVLQTPLLKEADAAAKKLRISRSELIARGLRSVLKKAS